MVLTENDKVLLTQFIGGGLEAVLSNIKFDIATEILGTAPVEDSRREDLYDLSRAIDAIKGKLQECVNDTYTQE